MRLIYLIPKSILCGRKFAVPEGFYNLENLGVFFKLWKRIFDLGTNRTYWYMTNRVFPPLGSMQLNKEHQWSVVLSTRKWSKWGTSRAGEWRRSTTERVYYLDRLVASAQATLFRPMEEFLSEGLRTFGTDTLPRWTGMRLYHIWKHAATTCDTLISNNLAVMQFSSSPLFTYWNTSSQVIFALQLQKCKISILNIFCTEPNRS